MCTGINHSKTKQNKNTQTHLDVILQHTMTSAFLSWSGLHCRHVFRSWVLPPFTIEQESMQSRPKASGKTETLPGDFKCFHSESNSRSFEVSNARAREKILDKVALGSVPHSPFRICTWLPFCLLVRSAGAQNSCQINTRCNFAGLKAFA